jgi:uracil-DNA glycosylase
MPFDRLIATVRQCRICVEQPRAGRALGHAPRPILQASPTAHIGIAGQAPGVRAHESGVPFSDPSGVRLRQWMGIDEAAFYDARRVAILPMGFCFPGLDAHGSDLPPRSECAPAWREPLLQRLPDLRLLLLVGSYAQRWHLRRMAGLAPEYTALGVNDTVRNWRAIYEAQASPRVLALPHPSWRNSGWLKRNPWFEDEVLPTLRSQVAALLG